MASSEFRGIFPYLVSAIGTDGSVLVDVLSRLVSDLIEAGVHLIRHFSAAESS